MLEFNLEIDFEDTDNVHLTFIPEKDKVQFLGYKRHNGGLSFLDAILTAYMNNCTEISIEGTKINLSSLGYLVAEKPLEMYDYKRFAWCIEGLNESKLPRHI